jgi:hypothetical protein
MKTAPTAHPFRVYLFAHGFGRGRWVGAASLREAKLLVLSFLDNESVGGKDWGPTSGRVEEGGEAGRPVLVQRHLLARGGGCKPAGHGVESGHV